jgi:hypothetical protein
MFYLETMVLLTSDLCAPYFIFFAHQKPWFPVDGEVGARKQHHRRSVG